jgi:thiamine transport system permease protein
MRRRDWLIDFVSGRGFRKGWTSFIIAFFLFFVVLPTLYIVSYAFTNWNAIDANVLSKPETMNAILGAIGNSFAIAGIVTLIDFLAGLPVAWILVRRQFRGKQFLDTLIDMPLAVPTAALGFSAAILWAQTGVETPFSFSLTGPFLIIVLLHILFTYPYMVRSLAAILTEIDETYEIAGRTLGASSLTAVRTITLPLFRAGLVTGTILCLARSLSETGGTLLALATINAGSFQTGPTLIGVLNDEYTATHSIDVLASLSFVSILLIVLSLLLLVILKLVIMRFRLPIRKVWPLPEKILSRGAFPKIKNGGSLLFLAFFVLLPSFFIFSYVAFATPVGTNWGTFWNALIYSFALAGIVTAIDIALGIPLALYISKNRHSRLAEAMDVLVNVPLIVPTAALGFSLAAFWRDQSIVPTVPFLLLVLAHVAFTYPLVVRSVAGAVEEVDPSFEETARTLGAKPIQSFRRVLYPIIKSSILAGAIMAFTRSLGETGATQAVLGTAAPTAPVFIVALVKSHAFYQAGLACIVLIFVSYLAMLALRYVTRKRKEAL